MSGLDYLYMAFISLQIVVMWFYLGIYRKRIELLEEEVADLRRAGNE